MNNFVRRLALPLLLGLGIHAAHAAAIEEHPGYLNLERLAGIAGRQPSVEVTLTGPVLKMLMQLPVGYDDADAAQAVELLKVVDHILVRVFPMDAERAEDMLAFINDTSATLESENWTRVVRVREENDSNVDIHVKLSEDGENLNGLAIMAVERGNDDDDDDEDENNAEVVFVNIVGNFNPAYLSNIGDQLDIDYLDELDVP
jgi:hypothetical protein